MNQMIELDLTNIETLPQLHSEMASLFGFPNFYGRNYPALVDCLSSLRRPEDGMTSLDMTSKDDVLELRVRNLAVCPTDIISTLLSAFEAVNSRSIGIGLSPPIHLLLFR